MFSMQQHIVRYTLSVLTLLLGLFMIIGFGGADLNPPTVSGLAFLLIAVHQILQIKQAS